MEQIKQQIQSAIEFVVSETDTNENGTLRLCRILSEVSAIHDRFVMLTFGDLNYYTVLNSSYHLDFTGQARKGDLIRLASKASINPGLWMDIKIEASIIGRKNNAIATGRFVFELQKIGKDIARTSMRSLYEYA